jgi:2-haloacid dehalogenase
MIKSVVFDLGGVLLDWNPRYLFRKLIDDEAAMEAFLTDVCTRDWHEKQDAGRSCAAAITERSALFPDHAPLIAAFYSRFGEMIGGAFEETVALLSQLRQRKVPLYALSNWPGDTFHHSQRFAFMTWFDGVVVSGFEKIMKPDPRIFKLLIQRYNLEPTTTLFIDDVEANINAAEALGIQGHVFRGPQTLAARLAAEGLIA